MQVVVRLCIIPEVVLRRNWAGLPHVGDARMQPYNGRALEMWRHQVGKISKDDP